MERKEWFAEVAQDARLAVRQLRRRPGFAVIAVLTLTMMSGRGLTPLQWPGSGQTSSAYPRRGWIHAPGQ